MTTCKICGRGLDPAELIRDEPVCDACVIKINNKSYDKKRYDALLATIPCEYNDENGRWLSKMSSKLAYPLSAFSDGNTYVCGERQLILQLGWAIIKWLWENQSPAKMENYLVWYSRYKNNISDRWDMLVEATEFNGVMVMFMDNMYGIDDQSVIYSVLQGRNENRNRTCILHNNEPSQSALGYEQQPDIMDGKIKRYIMDASSGYKTMRLTRGNNA